MEIKDQLRQLLDPAGMGIPRRAVIAGPGRIVVSKGRAPHEPEIDVLSELCHAVFDTEPRRPDDLLRRALREDIPSAWVALRDDIVWKYTIPIFQNHVPDILFALLHPTECKTFVCSRLIESEANIDWSSVRNEMPAIATRIAELKSDIASDSFAGAVTLLRPRHEVVARCLDMSPASAGLFVRLPAAELVAAVKLAPGALDAIAAHARSLRAPARYGPLAFLAIVSRAGLIVPHTIGTETLMHLRGTKFDARVAAAAAILAQTDARAEVSGMAHLIEYLSAAESCT
jgi:hypothetical protein